MVATPMSPHHVVDFATVQSIVRIIVLFLAGFLAFRWLLKGKRPAADLPLINPGKGWLSLFSGAEQFGVADFITRAQDILDQGFARYQGKPFNVATEEGIITVLPPEFAEELRNEASLIFLEANSEDFHGGIPGFDAVDPENGVGEFLNSVVRKQMTQTLGRVIGPVAEEASRAVEQRFGCSREWKSHNAYEASVDIVSSMTSRVFVGAENSGGSDEWNTALKAYTANFFLSASKLRQYPTWLRRFAAAYLIPECRELRAQVAHARAVMGSILEKRREKKRTACAAGEEEGEEDAIDWFEEESRSLGGRPYDAAMVQVALSLASASTTSDLLAETLMRLAYRPELVRELRAEIAASLKPRDHGGEGQGGWTKASLFNMKLLDSVAKETQRTRPISIALMSRKALRPVPLSTGTVLPTGSRSVVSMHLRNSPLEYPDQKTPLDVFDGHRFADLDETHPQYRLRSLASTSPAQMGFGHGLHACPGRFFAAAQLKIALCYALVKYDWELVGQEDGLTEEEIIKPKISALLVNVNDTAEVRARRRLDSEVEIDLESIGFF